jgi:hypothetical protein
MQPWLTGIWLALATLPLAAEPGNSARDQSEATVTIVSRPSAGAARPLAPVEPATGADFEWAESPEAPTGVETHAMPPEPVLPELTSELAALRDEVRRVLAWYFGRPLNTRDHNPWEVMHGIVAYGVDTEVRIRGPSGESANAVGWLCSGRPCRNERLLAVENGRPAARKGPAVQGHHGQFLAILAQSRVARDYAFQLDGRSFTIEDLVESEKLGCQSGMELTFKLISLAYYLESDAMWSNRDGEEWSISRLIREEIKAPIKGAACGGTHRLMGLAYAVRMRELEGQPVDGQFARAQTYLGDFHDYTFGMQNPDGSFSTEWFVRRGARPDLNRRLQTTGHILEWLAYSVPAETLSDERMVRAIDYLVSALWENRDRQWEIGPLGHGLHALVIYDYRLFKPLDDVPTVGGEGPIDVPLTRRPR